MSIDNNSSITLKAKPKNTERNLADLVGMLHHEEMPVSTEELCRAVDYSKDWRSFAKVSQTDASFLEEREDVIEEGRVNFDD